MAQNIVQHGGYTKYVNALAPSLRHGHTKQLIGFRTMASSLDWFTETGMSPLNYRYEEAAKVFFGYDHGFRTGNWAFLELASRDKSLLSAEAEAALVASVKLHVSIRKCGTADLSPRGRHRDGGDDDDDNEPESQARDHPPPFYVGGQPRAPATTRTTRESKNASGAGANSSAQSGNDRS
jgi:hypothetical protein